MHTRSHQRGLASVETILLLPFIVFFAALVVASAQIMLLIEHNAVEARTAAWKHELSGQDCWSLPKRRFGGLLAQIECEQGVDRGNSEADSSGQAFLQSLREDSEESEAFINRIEQAPAPTGVTGRAVTVYRTSTWTVFERNDSHAADIAQFVNGEPVWELDTLPDGHDKYLRANLSKDLFPNVFPNEME